MDTSHRIQIFAGPSEMQMVQSLTRGTGAPLKIDMDRGTSVHFSTKTCVKEFPRMKNFRATIEELRRVPGKGRGWMISGNILDCPGLKTFSGMYDTQNRSGHLALS